MGRTGLAALVLFCILVMPADAHPGGSESRPGAGGRNAFPPSGDWQISVDTVVESDLRFGGNVTVLSLATLTIRRGSTLAVRGEGEERLRFRVMVGASVVITEGSALLADSYISEPGTGLQVLDGSRLAASVRLVASVGIPEVSGSEIAVGPGEGGNASLSINCSSWGNFSRSNLTVIAGDGAKGAPGVVGGSGGNASLFLGGAQLSDCNLTVVAGQGGDGGDPPDNRSGAGRGGAGGGASARLDLSFISGCTINISAGGGGRGASGWNGLSPGDRRGGAGGRGGDGALAWNGTNLLLSDSNVSVRAGDGGRGADGGDAPPGSLDGGSGGGGGLGGTASVSAFGDATFTFVDSRLEADGGEGGAGGHFGLAAGTGTDGVPGNGGAGGDAGCAARLHNMFSGTNSLLLSRAGGGGAGGSGPRAAEGGPGGNASASVSVETSTALAAASLDRFELASRGGPGGEGGQPFEPGGGGGLPGRGGRGGDSSLALEAEGSITAQRSVLDCTGGPGGGSSDPNREGLPGRPSQRLSTEQGTLTNCSVSQTVGPVTGEQRWTLQNSRIDAGDHFNISEKGLAYEYWTKRVTVSDASGKPIMDGSATVEVWRNRTLVESSKSNTRGESEFTLLDALYSASGVQYRSYILSAWDTRGRSSPNLTVFWTPDLYINLVLLSKLAPPFCCITRPGPGQPAVIDAREYFGSNGTGGSYLITGRAHDSPRNDEPHIESVQLRFGASGEWADVAFAADGGGYYWSHGWEVFPWARRMLSLYPLGIIPVTIFARSFNGFQWSDQLSAGGAEAAINLTVRLLELPGPPPVIELTSPARSTAQLTAAVEVESGRKIAFDARVALSSGPNVTRWVWCFDDTGGFSEDCSTAGPPSTTHVYPADREGQYFYVILKVFDNASTRRVELLRAGVAYEEFGYDFDPEDGSTSVRLKVLVRAPRPPANEEPPPYWLAAAVAVGTALAAWFLRTARKGRPGKV